MTDDRPRGFGVAAGLDPDVARELAQRCEALGYASLWSNDHPGASGLETVAIFAAAARRPDVGVAVMALDRHEPPDIAQKIGEVGIAPAHLWLGIGAGFTKRPLGVVHEGITALREVLPKTVRIVVAAMGPKMCALAGAEADGAFLNWMTPEKARWARERVHEGAHATPAASSRRRSSGTCASPSATTPRERLLKEEAFYRQLHQGYIQHFEALGAPEGTVGVAARDPAEVAPQLAEYDGIDHIVVRALAHADADRSARSPMPPRADL